MIHPRVRSVLFVSLWVAGWACGDADLVLPEPGSLPSVTRSTVTANPVLIAAGSGTSMITVTVLGDSGAPVPGASVVVQATGEGNILTQPSGPTGPDGVARATLQSTEPGDKIISAAVNESLGLSQTASVTVTTGAGLPEWRGQPAMRSGRRWVRPSRCRPPSASWIRMVSPWPVCGSLSR